MSAARHDFGAGTGRPTHADDNVGGYVRAYEKDPANHTALRHSPSLAALLSGNAARTFEAPRALSRCAEGTPDITSVHGGRVEPTGHHRADCDTGRQLRAVLRSFTAWHATPDHRLDCALPAWGTGGNIGDRSCLELRGERLVLIEVQRRRGDFGGRRTYACDPASERAGRVAIRLPEAAGPSPTRRPAPFTGPQARSTPLVSIFVPKEEFAPGESGELIHGPELAN